MKLYVVTTTTVNLETLEETTITTIRNEDEMGDICKPKVLYKTKVNFSYRDKCNLFLNFVVTRIK